MPSDLPRPDYDPELGAALAVLPVPTIFTREMIEQIQANPGAVPPFDIAAACSKYSVIHTEHKVPGKTSSDPEVILSIFTPKSRSSAPRPCIYFIHGGGMVLGDRFTEVDRIGLQLASGSDAILTSVEYRICPKNPYPAPFDDCYSGLVWVSANTTKLGIDPSRIMIVGQSAGGNLAAAVALACRDRKGPKLCAQLLNCPMLDDRNITTSSKQYLNEGSWSRESNLMAWDAYLGDDHSTKSATPRSKISIYAAPGRATDLSNLPPAFIDVGSAEIFRDEDVAYATKLWMCGVQAELHVWPGAFHASDVLIDGAELSKQAKDRQTVWVKKMLKSKVDASIMSKL